MTLTKSLEVLSPAKNDQKTADSADCLGYPFLVSNKNTFTSVHLEKHKKKCEQTKKYQHGYTELRIYLFSIILCEQTI